LAGPKRTEAGLKPRCSKFGPVFALQKQVWKHRVSAETLCIGRIGPSFAAAKLGWRYPFSAENGHWKDLDLIFILKIRFGSQNPSDFGMDFFAVGGFLGPGY